MDERERRQLELIEDHVLASDLRLAARLSRPGGRWRPTALAVALAGITVVLVAITVGLILLGLVLQACLVTVIAAWPAALLRPRRSRRR
ncbi:DUF3040 domain-containing protein [Actinomycetospora chiangmaiensis]|uniref:DUF3040 domain-containing protein n=1 Tax=Actinomycetospora chiangmaiensis TaxID=402650 RepID=UPI0003736C35|nr:DUF3040 domain-containing protein [Actinomycetospora chiangmaiensis]